MQRIRLRRPGVVDERAVDERADALGEGVGMVQRHLEERDGQEARRSEVDRDDFLVSISHEVGAVGVREA